MLAALLKRGIIQSRFMSEVVATSGCDNAATASTQDDSSVVDSGTELKATGETILTKGHLRRQRKKAFILQKKKKSGGVVSDLSGEDAEAATTASTSYFFEHGLRKVRPYRYVHQTFAKERWWGRPIGEIMKKEFRSDQLSTHDLPFQKGRLLINGNIVGPDYMVKNSDVIENITHRHEIPVTDEAIEIIADTKDLLVVNKPSSIPVHPCGRYRWNSMAFIMEKEYGYENLRTLYRLDRLTSGVFILCKTEEKCAEMNKYLQAGALKKTYLALVLGRVSWDEMECNQPVRVFDQVLGIWQCADDGKASKTHFKVLSRSADKTLVECRPVTGRTHQIRLHLQFLGHAICNDVLYNRPSVWGELNGRGGDYCGLTTADINERLALCFSVDRWIVAPHMQEEAAAKMAAKAHCTTNEPPAKVAKKEAATEEANGQQGAAASPEAKLDTEESYTLPPTLGSEFHDPVCEYCVTTFRDPKPDDLILFLHAWKYESDHFSYVASPPSWAAPLSSGS